MTTHSPSQDARLETLRAWLGTQGFEADSVTPASADASFRRYFRAVRGGTRYIAMDAPPEHNDNHPFVAISQRLADAGLCVPEVVLSDLTQGFLVLSDLGSTHYLDALTADNVDPLYQRALDAVVTLQSAVDTTGLPVFNSERLQTEMTLFSDWYIGRHRELTLTHDQTQTLSATYALCIESALAQPGYFVHRDFHSRNLMVCANGEPGILDFQDGVIGPITYDAVSLLKDCYIRWPEDLVDKHLRHYHAACVSAQLTDADYPTFVRWFDWMGLQRHIKVLGIFCRLKYRDGKAGYMHDLPRVYSYVQDVCTRYEALAPFAQLLRHPGADPHFSS
ncbi:MAG TPA: aminoglycoside phosphotransferase, partial [Gammaproteobacteria bacterium]|nr:aminoglycoside phosphotransferase [Gammaproteobacteria bacterium]